MKFVVRICCSKDQRVRISGLRNRRKSFHFDVLGISIFIAINPVDAEHHCDDSVPATGPSFLCGLHGRVGAVEDRFRVLFIIH